MVSPTSTNDRVVQSGWKHFNRIPAGDPIMGASAARAAQLLGAKSAYIVRDNNEYGTIMTSQFAQAASQFGIAVNSNVVTLSGRPEAVASELADVIKANPDLVYVGAYYDTAATVARTLRDGKFGGILLGGDGLDSMEFPLLAGEAGNGVYYLNNAPSPEAVSRTEVGRQFLARYETAYGREPLGPITLLTYDAACVILQATLDLLKQHPGEMPSRADIVAAVRTTKGFEGVASTITFSDKGENLGAAGWLLQFRDGRYPGVYVDSVPTWQQ